MPIDIWFTLNFALAVIAAWVNIRRISKCNVRRGLRFAGFAVAMYVAVVYGAAIIGVIPEIEIRLWLRFFQGVIMAYIIAEALHG